MADAYIIQEQDPSYRDVPFSDRFAMLVDTQYNQRQDNRMKRYPVLRWSISFRRQLRNCTGVTILGSSLIRRSSCCLLPSAICCRFLRVSNPVCRMIVLMRRRLEVMQTAAIARWRFTKNKFGMHSISMIAELSCFASWSCEGGG